MTKAELLMNRRDEQTQIAIDCIMVGDAKGAEFHKNAAEGFKIKLNKLTIEEAAEEVSCFNCSRYIAGKDCKENCYADFECWLPKDIK